MTTTNREMIILLADDDFDDAEFFADALNDVDPQAKFFHAENGFGVFEQIRTLGNRMPSIIFLDLNMPEMDGWECLSILKRNPVTKNIPVMIYSTSSFQRDKQNALAGGASAFITKPSDYESLRKLMSSLTSALKRALREAGRPGGQGAGPD
jgi:CheY-like chemotaxis protein